MSFDLLNSLTLLGLGGNSTLGAQLSHLMDDIKHLLGGQSRRGDVSSQAYGSQFGGLQGPKGWGFGGIGNRGAGLGCASKQQNANWPVTNEGPGQDQIDLGKYTLNCTNGTSWTLTDKATGATTQVSGDPHVTSPDGQHFDFKQNLSFQLDDGTRITVKTVPAGNGATLSSELDITKGGHGMKVTGINGGSLQVTDGLNGYALDASNEGTDRIYEAGNGWQTFDGQEVTAALSARLGL